LPSPKEVGTAHGKRRETIWVKEKNFTEDKGARTILWSERKGVGFKSSLTTEIFVKGTAAWMKKEL